MEIDMTVEFVKDRYTLDKLMGRLTALEEKKDELLVKITFLRDLLEKEEEQLTLVRMEEDKIARELSMLSYGLTTNAA